MKWKRKFIFVKLSKICPFLAVQDTSFFNYRLIRLLGQSIQRNVRKYSINKKWKRCASIAESSSSSWKKRIFAKESRDYQKRVSLSAKFLVLITQRRKCKRLSDLGRIYTRGPVILHFFIIPSDTFRQDN